jgi:hypothetical protein
LLSRRFSLWQKLTAVAPVLLLLVYLPAQALLRCRMDGMLRTACCCPQERESQDTSPAMKAQDCCERAVTHAHQRPTAEAARPANRDIDTQMTAVALATPSADTLAPSFERPDGARQRHGPAREGPPIVLLKHAFLI